jgi:hypothetical protein
MKSFSKFFPLIIGIIMFIIMIIGKKIGLGIFFLILGIGGTIFFVVKDSAAIKKLNSVNFARL